LKPDEKLENKMKWMIILLMSLGITHARANTEPMQQAAMEQIIKDLADQSKGGQGVVEFTYQGMDMFVISDVTHDRMRILSPVASYSKLDSSQIDNVMFANFHRALDARYAVSQDVLYAVYIHQLSKLDKQQIESAVTQVFNLKASFGETYSSGVLDYQGK
jgi:hypothetical protein